MHIKPNSQNEVSDARKEVESQENETSEDVQDPEAAHENNNFHHHKHHEDPFFTNQFWRAPDIIDTQLEELLEEEGYYSI